MVHQWQTKRGGISNSSKHRHCQREDADFIPRHAIHLIKMNSAHFWYWGTQISCWRWNTTDSPSTERAFVNETSSATKGSPVPFESSTYDSNNLDDGQSLETLNLMLESVTNIYRISHQSGRQEIHQSLDIKEPHFSKSIWTPAAPRSL